MQIKHYVPGKKPITLTQLPEHIALDNDDLLWVNLVDPTPEYLTELVPFFENDGEEQDRLLESMLLKHHRPTIQQYETCSLIIAIRSEERRVGKESSREMVAERWMDK